MSKAYNLRSICSWKMAQSPLQQWASVHFPIPFSPASGEPKHYSSFATMVSVRTSNPGATRRNSLELGTSPQPIHREFSLFGLKDYWKAPFSRLTVTSPMPGCLLKIISTHCEHQWCLRHHYQLGIIKADTKKKKKLKEFGNERSIGWFERLQHIPGNLDGHIQVRAVAYPGKTWEGPDLSPLADLGLALTENEGWGKVIHCPPGH